MKAGGSAARLAPSRGAVSLPESITSGDQQAAALPKRAKSVLDLPQLELDCMKVLWGRGEASVREVWSELSSRRSLAYTTIETILNRLARKGVVTRVRNGRAFVYRPQFTAEQARHFALRKLLDNFFAGSPSQLATFLENPELLSLPPSLLAPAAVLVDPDEGRVAPRSKRSRRSASPLARPPRPSRALGKGGQARGRAMLSASSAIDESLL